MEEIWKDVKDYEGIYQVSNKGSIKRLAGVFSGANQFGQWETYKDEYVFSPSLDSKGYPQVALCIGKQKRTARVHRLVAEAFLKEPSSSLVEECNKAGVKYVLVNHKDGNPLNNCIDNLEWCSPKYNNEHSVEIGTHTSVKGEDNHNAVLSEEDVLTIYRMAHRNVISQEKIGEMFGVKQITVPNIKTGRSWSWLTGQKWMPRTRKFSGGESLAESDKS